MQQLGLTPTTTQPTVATVFATVSETEHGGNGIVYIASSSDLMGVGTHPGNNFPYEFEVVFEILPLDFARLASVDVSASGARNILAGMGVLISDRISLGEQSALLQSLAPLSLTESQIGQFVNLARITP